MNAYHPKTFLSFGLPAALAPLAAAYLFALCDFFFLPFASTLHQDTLQEAPISDPQHQSAPPNTRPPQPLNTSLKNTPKKSASPPSIFPQRISSSGPVVTKTPLSKTMSSLVFKKTFVLSQGQTLHRALSTQGISPQESQGSLQALAPFFNLKRLPKGQRFVMEYREKAPVGNKSLPTSPGKHDLLSLTFKSDEKNYLEVKRQQNGRFKVFQGKTTWSHHYTTRQGPISASFLKDAVRQGMCPHLLKQATHRLQYTVNFQNNYGPNNQCTLFYHEAIDEKTGEKLPNKLLMAILHIGEKKQKFYRYESASLGHGFFTSDGSPAQHKPFASPLPGAPISSHFSKKRLHPILGYVRPHNGIDLVAPLGTPVVASCGGVIKTLGRQAAYGNIITIGHPQLGFLTRYAHLSRYGAFKKGQHVKKGDVIGYVGSTGHATGPHLHFEIVRNGQPLNPASLCVLRKTALKKHEMAAFESHIKKIQKMFSATLSREKLFLSPNSAQLEKLLPSGVAQDSKSS